MSSLQVLNRRVKKLGHYINKPIIDSYGKNFSEPIIITGTGEEIKLSVDCTHIYGFVRGDFTESGSVSVWVNDTTSTNIYMTVSSTTHYAEFWFDLDGNLLRSKSANGVAVLGTGQTFVTRVYEDMIFSNINEITITGLPAGVVVNLYTA